MFATVRPKGILGPASVIAMLIGVGCSAAHATGGERIALAVGNGDYQSLDPLPGATRNAQMIASHLRDARFRVIEGTNLDRIGLEATLRRFQREIDPSDTVVLFYSGHSIEVDGQNYLVPVNARLDTPNSLEVEGIGLAGLIEVLGERATDQLVFLDAGYELDLGKVAFALGESTLAPAGQGITELEAQPGSLISFSTRPGKIAAEAAPSPYSLALSAMIAVPGLEIHDTLNAVRKQVIDTTRGAQEPWEVSSLQSKFYFTGIPVPWNTAPQTATAPRALGTTPLFLPAPAAGQAHYQVRILSLDPAGTLELGAKHLQPGDVIAASALPELRYTPAAGTGEGKAVLAYEVDDLTGTPKRVEVAITITEDPDLTDSMRFFVGDQASAVIAPFVQANAATPTPVFVGTGPQPLFTAAAVDEARKSPGGWLMYDAAPDDSVVMLDNALLIPGDMVALERVADIVVSPSVGSADTVQNVGFMLVPPGGGISTPVKLAVAPQVTDCDRMAGERLDPQGVVEGNFANEIDGEPAAIACAEAQADYPDVARFTYQLGRAYLAMGDAARGRELTEAAVDQGHIRANAALAELIVFSDPSDAARAKAEALLREGIRQGDPFAFHTMGRELANSDDADKRAEGLRYLIRAAEAGHTYSFNALGSHYLSGKAVPADADRALSFFEQSALRGDIYGFFNMGRLYRDGKGVPRDPQKAMEWFLRADEGGHPTAAQSIGDYYLKGEDFPKDRAAGIDWYRKSAARGAVSGNAGLARLIGNGTEAERHEALRAWAFVAWRGTGKPAVEAKAALAAAPARDVMATLQQVLNEVGLDAGTPDGKAGPRTRAAIAEILRLTGTTDDTPTAVLPQAVGQAFFRGKPRIDLF